MLVEDVESLVVQLLFSPQRRIFGLSPGVCGPVAEPDDKKWGAAQEKHTGAR